VHIRLATAEDDAAMAAIYAPYVEGSAISFEAVPPTADEMRRRFEDTLPRYPWLVAVEGPEVLGYAYGHRFAERDAYGWSVETSIYLHPDARGRGVGRALYRALVDLLTAQGYRQAFGGIALPNQASVALHESLGYRRVATYAEVGFKLRAWHDVGWWQRPLDIADSSPRAPTAVDELDPALVERVLRGETG
jgi:phosphinothricin acetyltransferase